MKNYKAVSLPKPFLEEIQQTIEENKYDHSVSKFASEAIETHLKKLRLGLFLDEVPASSNRYEERYFIKF